jgi:hypothetical protein
MLNLNLTHLMDDAKCYEAVRQMRWKTGVFGCMGGAGVARNFLLQLVNEIKANTAVDATDEVVGSWRYGRLQ